VTLLHNITLELSHRKICTKFFFLFLLTPQTDAGQTRKLRRERERERERERRRRRRRRSQEREEKEAKERRKLGKRGERETENQGGEVDKSMSTKLFIKSCRLQ